MNSGSTSALDSLLPVGSRQFLRKYGSAGYSAFRRIVGYEADNLLRLERNELIHILRWKYGCTQEQIGSVFGVTRQRVQQVEPGKLEKTEQEVEPRLPKAGRALLDMSIPVSEHRGWLIKELIGKGRTQVAVARQLHVPQTCLSYYTRKLGIDLSWRGGKVLIPDYTGEMVPSYVDKEERWEEWR